jgi:hypothetical protein
MTEENTGGNDTVASSNDTVAASNADTVVAGSSDTVASGGNDTVVANEFSWNGYVEKIKQSDEKLAKTLERYSSVDDVAKALFEAKQLISKGVKEPELPKNATEEQIKEYREKVGVPSSPDEYKFPEGMVIKDEDKSIWSLFGKFAIEGNIPQKNFQQLAPVVAQLEAAISEQGERDHKEIVRSQDGGLKEMWGSDAADNMKANEAFLINSGGEELAQMLLGATSSDGRPLGNNPLVAKWLNEQARQAGYADLMPYNNQSSVDDLNTKIQNLEKMMGDHNSAYWKGEHAPAKQKEYRELVSLRDKITARK